MLCSELMDCAIIIWRGGGGWETKRGGHRGKSKLEGGGVDVNFNTYRGGLVFALFFTNQKSGRRAISSRISDEPGPGKHDFLISITSYPQEEADFVLLGQIPNQMEQILLAE